MARAQCIVHNANRILMVKHRAHNIEWWCLPGGGVEDGETPAQAALRELKEECGVTGRIIRQSSQVSYGADDEIFSFLVDIVSQVGYLGHDPEFQGAQQILAGIAWLTLAEISERDREFLWAAGLLGIPEFLAEVEGWGDDPSYPQRNPF